MTENTPPGGDRTSSRDRADSDDEAARWQTPAQLLSRAGRAVRPDLRRGITLAVIAVISLIIGVKLNGIAPTQPQEFNLFGWHFTLQPGWVTLADVVFAVIFVVVGAAAARSIWRELQRVAELRAGPAAGQAVRLICTVISAIAVVLGLFAILQLDLRNLVLGGAVTGVIIGIAAQQTLNNFFAGLVLFFARPYVTGQRVKIRNGGLGGPFIGTIVGAGIMYTVIETDDEGQISLPNAALLGSAIGPAPDPEVTPAGESSPHPSADRDAPPPSPSADRDAPPPSPTTDRDAPPPDDAMRVERDGDREVPSSSAESSPAGPTSGAPRSGA